MELLKRESRALLLAHVFAQFQYLQLAQGV